HHRAAVPPAQRTYACCSSFLRRSCHPARAARRGFVVLVTGMVLPIPFPWYWPLAAYLIRIRCSGLPQGSGMTPEAAVQDETANNRDDSPADGVQRDHADQQECE